MSSSSFHRRRRNNLRSWRHSPLPVIIIPEDGSTVTQPLSQHFDDVLSQNSHNNALTFVEPYYLVGVPPTQTNNVMEEVLKKKIDISKLNLSNLKRIKNDDDINKIRCLGSEIHHKLSESYTIVEEASPLYYLDPLQKIIAIGDIHGDLTSLICILLGAELIDNNLEWIGKDTYVVFTGDLLNNFNDGRSMKESLKQFNKAPIWTDWGYKFLSASQKRKKRKDDKEERKLLNKEHIQRTRGLDIMRQHPADEITIISFLDDLNTQASKQAGRILLCLGLHEAQNLCNNFQNVSKSTMEYFSNFLGSREEQFKPNSILRQKLSCLFQPFILINDKYFFCHGGLTYQFLTFLNQAYPNKYSNPYKIRWLLSKFNEDVKKYILSGYEKKNRIHKMLKGDFGEWLPDIGFFSTNYYDTYNKGCDHFNLVREYMDLPDLILIKGKDAQLDHTIKESCDKKIYLIDTEISRAFQNDRTKLISDNMNYLRIDQGIFTIVNVKLIDDESNHKQMLETFIKRDPFENGIFQIIVDKLGRFFLSEKEISVEDWKKRGSI
jgi:hypothetical protein